MPIPRLAHLVASVMKWPKGKSNSCQTGVYSSLMPLQGESEHADVKNQGTMPEGTSI
jgi:hypothetical protein